MSEEAPLRDRSHIEKTLMLNEDKPADDYSGNQREKALGLGLGLGGFGGASEASGLPGEESLEVEGICGRDSASSVQSLGALDWQEEESQSKQQDQQKGQGQTPVLV